VRRARTALIYADVDAGLIDGSAVWLASVTDLLARAGCLVTLQLRDRHRRDAPLLQLLHGRPNIRILEPFTSDRRWHGRLPARRAAAAAMLHKLDAREGFDLVLVRGMVVGPK
jgi:hypothetical protein